MKIFHDFILSVVIMGSGMLALFYAESMIGKALSPELYGDYKVTITVIMLLGQLLLFGLDYIIMKHVPQLLKTKHIENAKFFLISMSKIVFCILLVWEVFSLLVDQSMHNLMFSKLLFDIHPAYFYLSCAGIYAFFTLILKTVRALNYKILCAVMYYSWAWVLIGFLLIIPITLHSAILSTMASSLIITCAASVVVFLFFNKVRAHKFILPPNIAKDAFYFTAQQMFTFQAASIFLIIMETLSVSEANIGIFSAAIVIANLSYIIIGGIKNVFMEPIVAMMYGDKLLLKKLLLRVAVVSTVSILVIDIVIYLLTPRLLLLYGLHFDLVLKFIPFILLANIPGAVTIGDIMLVNYFSVHTNRVFTFLIISKSVVTVVIGGILISFFNIYGAVAAYVAVEIMFALAVTYLRYFTIVKINDE